jgi:hypothetical protein
MRSNLLSVSAHASEPCKIYLLPCEKLTAAGSLDVWGL